MARDADDADADGTTDQRACTSEVPWRSVDAIADVLCLEHGQSFLEVTLIFVRQAILKTMRWNSVQIIAFEFNHEITIIFIQQ